MPLLGYKDIVTGKLYDYIGFYRILDEHDRAWVYQLQGSDTRIIVTSAHSTTIVDGKKVARFQRWGIHLEGDAPF